MENRQTGHEQRVVLVSRDLWGIRITKPTKGVLHIFWNISKQTRIGIQHCTLIKPKIFSGNTVAFVKSKTKRIGDVPNIVAENSAVGRAGFSAVTIEAWAEGYNQEWKGCNPMTFFSHEFHSRKSGSHLAAENSVASIRRQRGKGKAAVPVWSCCNVESKVKLAKINGESRVNPYRDCIIKWMYDRAVPMLHIIHKDNLP